MVDVAEAAAVGKGALALYTHSKGWNPKWQGACLDTALACRPSVMEGTGTVSGTGGPEFPFEQVQIEHLSRNAV